MASDTVDAERRADATGPRTWTGHQWYSLAVLTLAGIAVVAAAL